MVLVGGGLWGNPELSFSASMEDEGVSRCRLTTQEVKSQAQDHCKNTALSANKKRGFNLRNGE